MPQPENIQTGSVTPTTQAPTPLPEAASTSENLWQQCLTRLNDHFSEQELNTWLRPLQAKLDQSTLTLFAPNRFAADWVKANAKNVILTSASQLTGLETLSLVIHIGAMQQESKAPAANTTLSAPLAELGSPLNPEFRFDTFVEGTSNQLAKAATWQISENPGRAYNPLFLYGGVGLGKTHLMQSVGNALQTNKGSRVAYVHAERFVQDMVRALQTNTINEFKRQYRAVDALLVDDIQFFAGKERMQEEFFYTFNALLEREQQIVLTCDRYPKDLSGLEERLKSRFESGLVVCIEPPDVETRVAIIKNKSEQMKVDLPDEVAFFIAERVRSNVRELEGSLKRIVANARFTDNVIDLAFAEETLKDLLAAQQRLITIENIKRTVADYFNLRIADMQSKRRTRSITRPRQIAMSLAKELTQHSLPEIGDAFGGRDHTTVLHACKQIKHLRNTEVKIQEDYQILLRTLSA